MAENENQANDNERSGGRVRGIVQKIIGEIEEIGGALTGDPTTQAEGQFNVEVGEIREELEHPEDDKESAPDDTRI